MIYQQVKKFQRLTLPLKYSDCTSSVSESPPDSSVGSLRITIVLTKVYGSAVNGINATTITVEVTVVQGIKFFLVGLPDNAVKESQQRIESALLQTGFRMPGKKIVVNMAPADIRKEGSAYDLPIALGILAASGQLNDARLSTLTIMGELSLDGTLLPVRGSLPMAVQALKEGFEGIVVPLQNAAEAAIVEGINVYPAQTITEVVHFLEGQIEIPPYKSDPVKLTEHDAFSDSDFTDVKGQAGMKRALEIAAAGGHNVLLIGPPGAGKTMLARRLPGILPPLSTDEALETTKIHSVAGKLGKTNSIIRQRPFRSPHHTISDIALIGGGSNPQPGEISLAHNGVLFLDELPEFKRTALEVMRQPLEERSVTISRARFSVAYPASFMLVASMNPCPCGFYNHPERECVCPPGTVQRYLNKISGPLLDRIDLHVEVVPVKFEELSISRAGESSESIRNRVIEARKIQADRYAGFSNMHCNAQMSSKMLRKWCVLNDSCTGLLKTAMERLSLSARAYDRILKVARTIADLDGKKHIETEHLAEAIQLRSLDRSNWAG